MKLKKQKIYHIVKLAKHNKINIKMIFYYAIIDKKKVILNDWHILLKYQIIKKTLLAKIRHICKL